MSNRDLADTLRVEEQWQWPSTGAITGLNFINGEMRLGNGDAITEDWLVERGYRKRRRLVSDWEEVP